MSDGGYWVNSPENPFNQMDYTRGGGGYDNAFTTYSNANRAFAMSGSGNAMPRYASSSEAHKAVRNGNVPVFSTVGDALAFAKKYRLSDVLDVAGGLKVHTARFGFADLPQVEKPAAKPVAKPVAKPAKPGKPEVEVPATDVNGRPAPVSPGGVGPATPNPRTVGPSGSGAGNFGSGVFSGGGAGNGVVETGPMTPKRKDSVTQFQLGGQPWLPEPNTSDAEEVEARLGDGDFLSPAWFANWGIAATDIVHNVNTRRNDLGHQIMSGIDSAAKDWASRGNDTPYVETRQNPFMVAKPPY